MCPSSQTEVGPHAGDTNKKTLVLRDQPSLTPAQCATARRLRREGLGMEEIAEMMGVPLLHVSHALAGMRTPRDDPPRGTLNVSRAAHTLVHAERRPDEAIWQTVNRLLKII